MSAPNRTRRSATDAVPPGERAARYAEYALVATCLVDDTAARDPDVLAVPLSAITDPVWRAAMDAIRTCDDPHLGEIVSHIVAELRAEWMQVMLRLTDAAGDARVGRVMPWHRRRYARCIIDAHHRRRLRDQLADLTAEIDAGCTDADTVAARMGEVL